MKTTVPNLIEDLRAWGCEPSNPPAAFMSVVADQVVDAVLASYQEPVVGLRDGLTELLNTLIKASPEVLSGVLAPNGVDNLLHRAYQIGQISFAQLLTARQADRKISQTLTRQALSEPFLIYLATLAKRDHSNAELAELLDQRLETVSRKLKVLRGLGLTDFRRDGKHVINFLTEAGRDLLNETREPPRAIPGGEVMQALQRIRDGSSEPFKHLTSFAPPQPALV